MHYNGVSANSLGMPLAAIVYRAIAGYLTTHAGFTSNTAQTGAVTLIQRFGSALNLNVHFHGALPCAPPCGRPSVVQIGGPAVSTERLSLTAQGHIHYRLKTPYRNGTTHVVFEPLDKIAGNDFEPPQADPKGGGQDARNT